MGAVLGSGSTAGVKPGNEKWYELHCVRFIRWLKPRRLREVLAKDVTEWLRLMAGQPDTEVWKLRQADKALRVLFQEMLGMSWAVPWPVGVFGDPGPDWLRENEKEQQGGDDGRQLIGQRDARNRFATELERTVRALRVMHYSYRTEETYLGWAVRFLARAAVKTAAELNAEQVRSFLEDLAVHGKVAASTQNQALNAWVFFFREGLKVDLGELGEFEYAKRPRRLPVVLTQGETQRLLGALPLPWVLPVKLLYAPRGIHADSRSSLLQWMRCGMEGRVTTRPTLWKRVETTDSRGSSLQAACARRIIGNWELELRGSRARPFSLPARGSL